MLNDFVDKLLATQTTLSLATDISGVKFKYKSLSVEYTKESSQFSGLSAKGRFATSNKNHDL